MSRYAIIGRHGLLGSALADRLGEVTSYPTKDTKVLFDFGSYTHPTFDTDPDYFMRRTLDSFIHHLNLCHERGIVYVYPSSALVYEQDTQFSLFKKGLEHLAKAWKTRSIGLRIFPVYSPNDHGTVISQWCRQMAYGERPTIYGDGEQSRDFIYIDDVVDQILYAVSEPRFYCGTVNIGTGTLTSFNEVIAMINSALDTRITPHYVSRPAYYPQGLRCPDPLPRKVSVQDGIQRILASLGVKELQPA